MKAKFAGVAQLVEQLICNQQVGGSSPSTSSTFWQLHMGEFPSGQRGQTVNLLSVTSVVRIHLPPPRTSWWKSARSFCCMKRKISSSPRADSIFSFSLFFARPSSFGKAHFLFLLRGSAAVPVSAACAAGKLRRTIAAACWQVQRTCQQNQDITRILLCQE